MDPRDQTFMTIHNLTPDANILFASESVFDILGYTSDEVQGKSCFDYFHPDEVPFARSIHSRGVLLDKAAVLHYARILSKEGRWVNCECCFTIVHDVLVASTSIYQQGEKSSRRALEAPQIRRIFSSSPRDPRYHMLEHLSPKFKMPPMEREPRAALILNRFTRNLSIMFATNAVASILGLEPHEIKDKAFYECIQENCLQDAIQCLESAKANESIAYLRFWYRDPRPDAGDQDDDADEEDEMPCGSRVRSENGEQIEAKMEIDDDADVPIKMEEDDDSLPVPAPAHQTPLIAQHSPSPTPGSRRRPRRRPAPSFELEAVVSCTSDGLVVVLRKARPPIPLAHPPLPPPFNFENGLFAAPWGQRPIEPYIPPNLLYTFRPPLLPQYMPLRESVKAAGGPPLDQLMRSIRDVAVFAWALTGINGNLANYSRGLPGGGAQPPDGLPVWEPAAQGLEKSPPRWDAPDSSKGKRPASKGLPYGPLQTGHHPYSPIDSPSQRYGQDDRPRRQSPLSNYNYNDPSYRSAPWAHPSSLFTSVRAHQQPLASRNYLPGPPQSHYEYQQASRLPAQSPPSPSPPPPISGYHMPGLSGPPHDPWGEPARPQSHSPRQTAPTTQPSSPSGASTPHLRYGWP